MSTEQAEWIRLPRRWSSGNHDNESVSMGEDIPLVKIGCTIREIDSTWIEAKLPTGWIVWQEEQLTGLSFELKDDRGRFRALVYNRIEADTSLQPEIIWRCRYFLINSQKDYGRGLVGEYVLDTQVWYDRLWQNHSRDYQADFMELIPDSVPQPDDIDVVYMVRQRYWGDGDRSGNMHEIIEEVIEQLAFWLDKHLPEWRDPLAYWDQWDPLRR